MPYPKPATPGQSSCSSVSNGRTLIGDADYFPCGPVNATTTAVPCCRRNHTCMEGGLCSYQKKTGEDEDENGYGDEDGDGHGDGEGEGDDDDDADPVITSYYASGCTDPSFADPACKRLCVTSIAGDVVYNGTGWYWRCCANSQDVDCAKPLSDETFNLPPPNELKAYFQIPATGVAFTSAAAPTSAPSSSPGAPGPSNASPSSGGAPLSHGAAAGIGVGVTASVALIAWAAWFIARRARAKRARPAESLDSGGGGGGGDEAADPFATPRPRHTELESPVAEKPRVEMTSHPYLAPELPGSSALYELSAEPPSRGKSRPPSPPSPLSPVIE